LYIDINLQVLKKSRKILRNQGSIRSSRKEIDPLEDLHIGFRIILIQILKEWDRRVWIRLIWLKIGIGGRLL